jgi:hypothetical protein
MTDKLGRWISECCWAEQNNELVGSRIAFSIELKAAGFNKRGLRYCSRAYRPEEGFIGLGASGRVRGALIRGAGMDGRAGIGALRDDRCGYLRTPVPKSTYTPTPLREREREGASA